MDRSFQPMWVYDAEAERIVQRDISYVPGLYKIFDEVLVNAADNKQRDPKMSTIKVTINKFVLFIFLFLKYLLKFFCFVFTSQTLISFFCLELSKGH